MDTQRINLWSGPRNVSTAFMYSFSQRRDCSVVDEPLYAHYLSRQDDRSRHPGEKDILQAQEEDGSKVVDQVIFGDYDTRLVLFKQMTHHLVDLSMDFLEKTDNILLIRDPRAIIASYHKVVSRPGMQDIGIEQQHELFEHLREIGTLKAVIDARELLLDPESVLRHLCFRLAIPWDPGMLQWPAGPKPEDGVWAGHWYESVHRSTAFLPYEEKTYQLPAALEKLARKCQPYYEELYFHALKAS
ncbi:MAG: hypothetical protein R3350_00585 [Saprospiraceae bacterium]|nr:hypothetical protein [Saprospiraceae bacterium]